MALFESYERRIDKIKKCLKQLWYCFIEEAEKSLKMQVLTYTTMDKGHSADLF